MKFNYWDFGNKRQAIYSEDRNFWRVAEESNLSLAGQYSKEGRRFAQQYVGDKDTVLNLVKQLGNDEGSETNKKISKLKKKCIKCGENFNCNSNRQMVCEKCRPLYKRERQKKRQQKYRNNNRG